jgi:hypothetical protein
MKRKLQIGAQISVHIGTTRASPELEDTSGPCNEGILIRQSCAGAEAPWNGYGAPVTSRHVWYMAELQAGVVMPSLDNLSVSPTVTGAHWAMYNTQLKIPQHY